MARWACCENAVRGLLMPWRAGLSAGVRVSPSPSPSHTPTHEPRPLHHHSRLYLHTLASAQHPKCLSAAGGLCKSPLAAAEGAWTGTARLQPSRARKDVGRVGQKQAKAVPVHSCIRTRGIQPMYT